MKVLWGFAAAAGLAALGAGCASPEPAAKAISSAELSVRKADASFASKYAPLELVKAREKLELAKQTLDEGDYDQSRRLAEQALVDARLAEEKARTARAHQTAEEMRRSVETLRSEAERYSSAKPTTGKKSSGENAHE